MARQLHDYAEFLDGPNSVLVAGRDAELRPAIARAIAARCEDDPRTVSVFLPGFATAAVRAQFESNRAIAVSCTRLMTHQAIQLKGRVIEVREAKGDELPRVEGAWRAFIDECEKQGLPRRVLERVAWSPPFVVRVEVAEIFEQTPGPGAGARVSGGEAR